MTETGVEHPTHQYRCARGNDTMCEINAYLERQGEDELLLELVERVEAGEGGLRVVNMFGEEKVVSGRFQRFSLREGKIVLTEDV